MSEITSESHLEEVVRVDGIDDVTGLYSFILLAIVDNNCDLSSI